MRRGGPVCRANLTNAVGCTIISRDGEGNAMKRMMLEYPDDLEAELQSDLEAPRKAS